MSNELVQVPFHGDVLEATRDADGTVWVSLRRGCENLGLSMEGQLKKLKGKPWATMNEKFMVAEDGRMRPVTMISLNSLAGWLFSIEAKKVREEIREKLARYQIEAAAALTKHFFGSDAVATPPPPPPVETLYDLLSRKEVREFVREVMTAELKSLTPPMLAPAVPRFTIAERLRYKGWPHASKRQRAQVRRMANALLDLRHQETPDVWGGYTIWSAHQLAVLDDAIDRVKEEYAKKETGGIFDKA